MTMRRAGVAAIGAVVALLSSIVVTPVFGETSGTVNATVTALAPCITISSATLNFPTTKFSTSSINNISTAAGPGVTNCSSVSENLQAMATDATGTGSPAPSWTLVTPPAPAIFCSSSNSLTPKDKFALNFWVSTTEQLFLSCSAQTTVKSGLASSSTMTGYNFELNMPCTGSSGAGVPMSFSINFTAVLP